MPTDVPQSLAQMMAVLLRDIDEYRAKHPIGYFFKWLALWPHAIRQVLTGRRPVGTVCTVMVQMLPFTRSRSEPR